MNIGAWLCRHDLHAFRFHHRSGANQYHRCARRGCGARGYFWVGSGYSPVDQWWLDGNDGDAPPAMPPHGGSAVKPAVAHRSAV